MVSEQARSDRRRAETEGAPPPPPEDSKRAKAYEVVRASGQEGIPQQRAVEAAEMGGRAIFNIMAAEREGLRLPRAGGAKKPLGSP